MSNRYSNHHRPHSGRGAYGLTAALILGVLLGALLFCPAKKPEPAPRKAEALSLLPSAGGASESDAPSESSNASESSDAPESGAVVLDSPVIEVSVGGEPVKMQLEDYVAGVVAGEMPADSEPAALAAQAVAARTFAALHMAGGARCKSGCTVCDDASCCQAYLTDEAQRLRWGDSYERNSAAIREAVDSTRGVVAVYDGKLISALYHASSGPSTESCEEVFACALPYLVSVESFEGEHEVVTKQEFSEEELVRILNAAYPEANMSVPLSPLDLDIWGRTPSGRVQLVRIGDTVIPGSALRMALGLKSTAFEVEKTGSTVTFTCLGYGHGVGMSQTGAIEMAKHGSTYEQILKHFYTGTELSRLEFEDGE